MREDKNKNQNVSFDNTRLLASLLSQGGSFAALTNEIKSAKIRLDKLTKEAKAKEKELLQAYEIENSQKTENDIQIKTETPQSASATIETSVDKENIVVKEVPKPTATEPSYQRQQTSYDNRRSQFNNKPYNNFNNAQRQSNFGKYPLQQRGTNQFAGNRFNQGTNRPNYSNQQRSPFGAPAKKSPFVQKLTKPLDRPVLPAAPKRDFSNKKKSTDKKLEDKKVYNKRQLIRRGLIEERNIEERMLSRKLKSKKKENPVVEFKEHGPAVITTDNITVKLLSETIGKSVSEIIKKFMLLGMMVTINSVIDFQTAELIASEMGVELKQNLAVTSEEKLQEIKKTIRTYSADEAAGRPPIVTVMGHVDHGKTSLLDYIRKTKVASGEAGGITQHIGAYMVTKNNRDITFIDTPGHEAFSHMRARGAMVTDIAILVVAADDGIMPQTVEAINHIKAAKVPMIVAINKMDRSEANADRIMQQLTEHNVVPEAWGGDAIIVKISAKTGEGIDKLLEMILLVADMADLKANPNSKAMGTVLEANLDKGKGAVASVLVNDGTLRVGDTIVAGVAICKIKAMIDDSGSNVKIATPSMPVSILGFDQVPKAGDEFTVVDEKLSKQIVNERRAKIRNEMTKSTSGNSLEDMMTKIGESDMKVLNIVLKTDVNGSLEAIVESIAKLNNDKVSVNILHSGVGAISESDIILASASNAIVVGFNVRMDSKAKTVSERMKVDVRFYKIIYELLEDIEKVMKSLKDPVYREEVLGHAEILLVFKLTGTGYVAGSMVKDGKIVRNEHARIIRDGEVVSDTMINSIKIQKDDAKEVAKGYECGIKLNTDDYKIGDIIECYALRVVEE